MRSETIEKTLYWAESRGWKAVILSLSKDLFPTFSTASRGNRELKAVSSTGILPVIGNGEFVDIKKLSYLFLILFIFLSFPSQALASGASASISRFHGIPVITITSKSNDYYQLGKAHGEIIRKTEKNASINMKKFINREKMFYNDMDLEYLVSEMEKRLPERYRREMQGFADGINGRKNGELTYKDITFINLVGDATRSRVMCSAIAFDKGVTGDGKILLGRNLDWIDGGTFHLVSAITIFRLRKVSLASLGISGLSTVSTGINNHGVFIAVLSAIQKTDSEFRGQDSVIFGIRYALEESKNSTEAIKILSNKQFPYSCIFMVGDGKNAVILEKSGKQFAIRKPGGRNGKVGKNSEKEKKDKDILIATNHFTGLNKKNNDKNSAIRLKDLEKEAVGLPLPLGVKSMEKLLTLCSNRDNPVYQRLTEERKMKFATLMSLVVKPEDLSVWIWFARKVPAEGKPVYERMDLRKYF